MCLTLKLWMYLSPVQWSFLDLWSALSFDEHFKKKQHTYAAKGPLSESHIIDAAPLLKGTWWLLQRAKRYSGWILAFQSIWSRQYSEINNVHVAFVSDTISRQCCGRPLKHKVWGTQGFAFATSTLFASLWFLLGVQLGREHPPQHKRHLATPRIFRNVDVPKAPCRPSDAITSCCSKSAAAPIRSKGESEPKKWGNLTDKHHIQRLRK